MAIHVHTATGEASRVYSISLNTTTDGCFLRGRGASCTFRLLQTIFVCNCVLQVRYTGYMDKTLHERQLYLRSDCREGHANVVSNYVLLSYRLLTLFVHT